LSNQLRTLRYSEDLDGASASEARASGTAEVEGCLSDDEILAFAEGRLGAAGIERVHAHVDRCEICQQLLNQAVHGLTPASLGDGDTPGAFSAMLQPEELLHERYRIIRFLASGGMGEVYEAFDLDLGVRVALKTVKSTACDSERAIRRLKMEVQLARRVSHANVCRIFDLGTHQSARDRETIHFLTMEYVEGRNLGDRLRAGGAFEVTEAIAVAQQLLRGLGAAHAAGILHRDFKSDNVMLRQGADAALGAVILDFGLARCLDAAYTSHVTTGKKPLLGTLRFMAPEQIEGKPLTVRTDLYAFGMVLFEMLTGVLPFAETTVPATALFQRLREPAPAPSKFNASVPAGLDAIVARCLGRRPEERFSSAAEALAALEAFERRSTERPARPRTQASLWAAPLALAFALTGVQEPRVDEPAREASGESVWPPPDSGIFVMPAASSRVDRGEAVDRVEPPAPVEVEHVPPPPRPQKPRGATKVGAASPNSSSKASKEPLLAEDGTSVAPAVLPPVALVPLPALAAPPVLTAIAAPARTAARAKPDWENPFARRQAPQR
jgi:serine/threonine protein kinase